MSAIPIIRFSKNDVPRLLGNGFWYISLHEQEIREGVRMAVQVDKHYTGEVIIRKLAQPIPFFKLTEMHSLAAMDMHLPDAKAELKNIYPQLTPGTLLAFCYLQYKRREPNGTLWMLHHYKELLGIGQQKTLSLFNT